MVFQAVFYSVSNGALIGGGLILFWLGYAIGATVYRRRHLKNG